MPYLSVKIANAQTPMTNGDKSTAGHMWYTLTDDKGNTKDFGFSSIDHIPLGAGHVTDKDSALYSTYTTQTVQITQEQYNAMYNFGTDFNSYGFDQYYNAATNCCIDFVWKALEVGGFNPESFQGNPVPSLNQNYIERALEGLPILGAGITDSITQGEIPTPGSGIDINSGSPAQPGTGVDITYQLNPELNANDQANKLAENLIPIEKTLIAESGLSNNIALVGDNFKARTDIVNALTDFLNEEGGDIVDVKTDGQNLVLATSDGQTFTVNKDGSHKITSESAEPPVDTNILSKNFTINPALEPDAQGSQTAGSQGQGGSSAEGPFKVKESLDPESPKFNSNSAFQPNPQVVAGLNGIASGLNLYSCIESDNELGATSAAVNLLNSMGRIAGWDSNAMASLGVGGAGLAIVGSIQGLSSDDALTQVQSVGNLLCSMNNLYTSAVDLAGSFTASSAAVGGAQASGSAASLAANETAQGITSSTTATGSASTTASTAAAEGAAGSAMESAVAVENAAGSVTPSLAANTLGTAANAAGVAVIAVAAVSSIISLANAFESGSPSAMTASFIQAAVSTFTAVLAAEAMVVAATTAGATASSILAAGITSCNPYVIVAAAIVAAAIAIWGDELFGHDPPPDPPTGEAHFVRNADGSIGISVSGAHGGAEILQVKMAEILAELKHNSEATAMEIIPERMPSLKLVSWPSYSGNCESNFFFEVKLNDPTTGEERKLGFARQDVVEKYTGLGQYTEGFVEKWEARQIEIRNVEGDPNYAETEGQYAHRVSKLPLDPAPEGDSSHQALTAMVVDLGGDGISKLQIPEHVGKSLIGISVGGTVRFDVDDDGYREALEWLGNQDAFLAFDRNGDGMINNARELLAGANVAADVRGRELLSFFDANHDGVLDKNDPAFSCLKLWLDVNGNGLSEADEVFGLWPLGVESVELGDLPLDPSPAGDSDVGHASLSPTYGSSERDSVNAVNLRFQDGSGIGAQEITLEAERDGVAVYQDQQSGNFVVLAENGVDGRGTDARLNYVVQAEDLSQLTKLLDPKAGISDEERGKLIELARKYGLNPDDPDFARKVSALKHAEIKVEDKDVISNEILSAASLNTQQTIRQILSAASDDPSGLFAGAGAGLMVLAMGGGAIEVQAAEAHTNGFSEATIANLGGASSLTGYEYMLGADPQKWAAIRSGEISEVRVYPESIISAPSTPVAGIPRETQDVLAEKIISSSIHHGERAPNSEVYLSTLIKTTGDGNADNDSVLFPDGQIQRHNLLPVAMEDRYMLDEDTHVIIRPRDLVANDRDIDSITSDDNLIVTDVRNANHGTVQFRPDGNIVFIPEQDYHGQAGFEYTVMDQAGNIAVSKVVFEIAPVNDAPVVTDEIITSGVEDTNLSIASALLLANDSDVDIATESQSISISSVGNAQHGTVSIDEHGQIIFSPDANYNGEASFQYTVSDNAGGSTVGTTIIEIAGVNDLPVVTDETITSGVEDTRLRISQTDLLANDTDVDIATDGQKLTITSVSNAAHGSVLLDENGNILFTPDPNFHGTACFQYTIEDGAGGEAIGTTTIEVAAVNDAPIVFNEEVTGGVEDTRLIIDMAMLLANDTDVDIATGDGDVLSISAVSNSRHGTVEIVDGHIEFMPDPNFNGTATFDYTVSDGKGGETVGTASLIIEAVNDAPIAVNETIGLNEDEIALIDQSVLLANDIDVDIATNGDCLHIASVSNAQHGTVELNENHEVVFTPDANFYGQASFDYVIEDDAGLQSMGHTTLDYAPVNDAPVAVGETFTGGVVDSPIVIPFSAILQNDLDVDGDALRLVSIDSVSHGTTQIDWDHNEVIFTPDAGYAGMADFHYSITDDQGGYADAIMNVKINGGPTAQADGITVLEDGGATDYDQSWGTIIQPESLLANDSDPNGDPLHIGWVGNGTNCTVTLQDDGTIRITTPQNYHGTASFQYQAFDNEGLASAPQNVTVEVLSVNDRPVIEAIEYGKPVYCYTYTPPEYVFDPNNLYWYWTDPQWTGVEDYNTALSLFQSNQAYANGSSIPATAEYYQSGTLRPMAFDSNDILMPEGNYLPDGTWGPAYWIDDDFYEHGRIMAWDPDGDAGSMSYQITANPLHGIAHIGAEWTYWGYSESFVGDPPAPLPEDPRPVSAGDPNEWVYQSQRYDSYSAPASFTVRVTDADGAYADAQVNVTHFGSSPGKPVAIDLDRDGLEFVGINDANIFFDINGDGWREHIAWTNADDGLLAFDNQRDGVIDQHDEVSFVNYSPGAQTDLEGLRAFDTDHDGKLTSHDQRWAQFGVWQDKNQDGICDSGEFRNLNEFGMASINLISDGVQQVIDNDVLLYGTTQYEMADGTTGLVGDAAFRYTNEVLPAEPPPPPSEGGQIETVTEPVEVTLSPTHSSHVSTSSMSDQNTVTEPGEVAGGTSNMSPAGGGGRGW